MHQRRTIELSPQHPLAGFAAITQDPGAGTAQFLLIDGRAFDADLGIRGGAEHIRTMTLYPHTATLRVLLHDGTELDMEIGTQHGTPDAPVVYLDQNHWIYLARALNGSGQLTPGRQQAYQRLAELANRGELLLPVSAAHLGELAKKGGRQRTELGQVMMGESRGWQMRSPLQMEAHELDWIFSADVKPWTTVDVFTPEAGVLWSGRNGRARPATGDDPLQAEVQGLVDRLSWTTALVEAFVDPQRVPADAALAVAEKWALSFHALAQEVRALPRAKQHLRLITRFGC